ncbi:hypothetical protein ACCO45_004935 [Purpureocillium lilacinum]|uniref:Uncharacterized protein n=1 Tax=Purpureocillium lilacinum TaxID=33203 RepID=A0ACC4DUN5_PURLI
MASAVADLEAGLQAMLNLKPPGVSGSRITSLTSLCVANVQSESVLIQKIYTHFKKAPGTHKLGVLYVVDSVTRKWLEQAKAQGQTVNSSAQDGTYAAGVHRVTELMPVLMNDIIQSAPDEQKEKIKKLLDIWEKGQTFPQPMLESFKQKLSASPPASTSIDDSPGSPPAAVVASYQNQQVKPTPPAAPAPTGSSILEALANIARQNTTSAAPSSSALPAPAASYSYPAASMPQSVTMPPSASHRRNQRRRPRRPGRPFDKIPALIQSMTGGNNATAQQSFQPPVPAAQGSYPAGQQLWPGADNARDRGYQDGMRSPRHHGRSRSRSPDRGWGSKDSPRGGRDRHDDRDRNGRRSNDYRQRSPQGRRGRSATPTRRCPRLSDGLSTIALYRQTTSRSTAAPSSWADCSEAELRNIFSRFGTVQTCIVNRDKRHAFVKMLTRKDAVNAKESTEDPRNIEIPLRRGKPIESGMAVEEPDIEIGAGVSSKAISRRMQTDKGGSNGPKSTRNRDEEGGGGGGGGGGGRGRRNRDRRGDHGDNGAGGQQPPASGFPFGMGNLPSGMPNFPAGFGS